MRIVGTCSRIYCFLVVVLLASVSTAQSQDVFREVNQIKSEVSGLKSEVNDLRRLVLELRKVVLDQTIASDRQAPGRTGAEARAKEAKPPEPVDHEQITKIACRAVGKFFKEADSALRSSDPNTAREKMIKAREKLTSALHDYSMTHRVSKLLTIYEGLAWNTYTAVQLRQSITGNEDFLAKLRKHRKRYRDTCPRR